MNKNKSIPSNQPYPKKKNYNYSRLLNDSTHTNINQSSHLDSTTIKSKQNHNLNPNQKLKKHNKHKPSSSLYKECDNNHSNSNKRPGFDVHIQNYTNKSKIKARNFNNSFTSFLSSEQLQLHLSNQQLLAKQDISFKEHTNNNNKKPNQSTSKKFNSTSKTFLSLLNKSKPVYKNIHNTSYFQFKSILLDNPNSHNNKAKHINKSAYYDEEFKESFVSSSLIERLKKIECQMDKGLVKINNINEKNLIIKAKSYQVYKVAFEKVTQELPKEYIGILNRIIDGYHQIVSIFISEHKKLLECFDETKTKHSVVTREYSNFKHKSNSIEYNIDNNDYYYDRNSYKSNHKLKDSNVQISLNKRMIKEKDKDSVNHKGNNHNHNISYNELCIANGINSNANTRKHLIQKKIEYANSIPLKQSFSPNVKMNNNKEENETLNEIYFIDKVQMRNHSVVKINQNVPKLPFDNLK